MSCAVFYCTLKRPVSHGSIQELRYSTVFLTTLLTANILSFHTSPNTTSRHITSTTPHHTTSHDTTLHHTTHYRWTFLQQGKALGVPVSPFLELEDLVVKNKNMEGGLGIYFFKNALNGGDYILQKKIRNADWWVILAVSSLV